VSSDLEKKKEMKKNSTKKDDSHDSDSDSDDLEYLTYMEMKNTIDLLTLYI
jgi:hypothetical protein